MSLGPVYTTGSMAGSSPQHQKAPTEMSGPSFDCTLMLEYRLRGPVAHLVERAHGMGEVAGSSPVGSTKLRHQWLRLASHI